MIGQTPWQLPTTTDLAEVRVQLLHSAHEVPFGAANAGGGLALLQMRSEGNEVNRVTCHEQDADLAGVRINDDVEKVGIVDP